MVIMKAHSSAKNRYTARVALIAALAVVMFFAAFSDMTYAASAAKIKTQRVSKPTVTTQKSFSTKGLVTSDKKISKAKVGVKNDKGKWIISKTRTINGTSFKLSSFDSYLKFKSVGPGKHHYRCEVTLSNGKRQTAFDYVFYVYKITSGAISCESKIYTGETLELSGNIKVKPYIEKIKIGVTDSKKNWLKNHYSTVSVSTGAYDFASAAPELINADTLSPGTYYVRASAYIGGKSVKNVEKKFVVEEGVSITTDAPYPEELAPGKGFSVKGTLTSNAVIDSVKLGIIDKDDKWVYTASAKPADKTYSLAALNSKMKFKELEGGEYIYRCIATVKSKEYEVFSHSFAVLQVTSSGITHPDVIMKGDSFSLKGTVKSEPSMSSITVGVKKNGSWLKNYYVTSKKSLSSYDINKNADSSISFGKLSDGDYTYECTVTVLGREKTVFSYPFEVASDVSIKLSGVSYPPLQLAAGKAFSIGGTITSSVEITKVGVGIVDNRETWRVYKDFTPKSKKWNIASADSYIRFGTLPTGEYKYRIVVYIGSKAYTKVDYAYTVIQLNKTVSASEITSRINQLIDSLDGKYFTTDGKKAASNVDSRCNVENVLKKNQTVRSLIKKYKGGEEPSSAKNLPEHYAHDYGTTLARGYSCCGFANFAGWFIFAENCESDIGMVTLEKEKECNYSTCKNLLKPGDTLRVSGSISNGHSLIVISVKSSGIEILDCNSTQYSLSDKKASRVCHYTVPYSKINYMSVSRATNSPYLK